MGAYLASKAGIEALTRVASIEGSPYGVRVNTLHPGPVDDSLLHTKIPEKQIEDLKKKNPLNKLATKEEIAQAALWLLSSEAGHINGTSLCIDGGESLII